MNNIIRLWLICSALMIAMGPKAEANTRQESARWAIAAGKEYFRQKQYAEASHEFSKALLLDPFNPEAQHYYDRCSESFYGREQAAPVLAARKIPPAAVNHSAIKQVKFQHPLRRPARHVSSPLPQTANNSVDIFPQSESQDERFLTPTFEEIEALKITIQDISSLLRDKVQLVEAKEKELSAVREQISGIEKEFSPLSANGQQDLPATSTQQIESVRRTIAQKEHEKQELKTKIALAQKENEKHTALENALVESMKTHSREKAAEINSLQVQLTKLEEKSSDQLGSLKDKDSEVAVLKSRLAERQKAVTAAQIALARTQREFEGSVKQVAQLQAKLEQHNQMAAKPGRDRKVEQLEDILFKNRMELAYLNNKTIVADYYVAEGHSLLIEKNQKILELLEAVSTLEQEVVHLQSKIIASNGQLDKTDGKIDKSALIKRQDKVIFELKERLALALTNGSPLGGDHGDRRDEKLTPQIEALLNVLSERLSQATVALQEKTRECLVLESQIKSAQQKLDSAAGDFQVNDEIGPTLTMDGRFVSSTASN